MSIDKFVEYLHSEWLYTLADLQLGKYYFNLIRSKFASNSNILFAQLSSLAYADDGIWQNLKIPSRLKLELKKYLLRTDNGRSSYDEDISLGQSISPRISFHMYDSVSHVSMDNDYDSDYSERVPKYIQSREPVKPENSVTYIPYEPEESDTVAEEVSYEPEESENVVEEASPPVTCDTWVKCFSDEHKYYYYYNKNTQESQWECPDDSKVYLMYEDIMSIYDNNEVESESAYRYEAAAAYEGDYYDGSEFQEYGNDEHKQHCEPDLFSEEVAGDKAEDFSYGIADENGHQGAIDENEQYGRKKKPQVFHFKDLSPEDGKKFLKPLQKRGKTIFAESPSSIMSSIIDQDSPKSKLYRKNSGLSSCHESLEEKESFGIAEENDDDDDDQEVPFYVSPVRRSAASEISDDTESDSSEYFVVSEVHSSPSKRSVTQCDSNSKPKVRVPLLAIQVDAPMISREEFMSTVDDSYSVSLRDLAMGSMSGSPAQRDLRTRGVTSPPTPPQNPPPTTEVIAIENKSSSAVDHHHPDESKNPAKKLKKTTSAAKKMFKFMNSIVGSKSSTNIHAPATTASEKPSNLKMGSQFSQTLQRTEKASSNTAEDGAVPLPSKSTEFQYEEVYPQSRDDLLQNKSIAGVNTSARRGSIGSAANFMDSGRTTLDSQRTLQIDSQQSSKANPVGTVKHGAISIDIVLDGGVSGSVASSASTDRQSDGSYSSPSGLTPSSSAKEKLITNAKTFFQEMKSMGFTELECTKALESSDSNVKQASLWLLQEAAKNETESQGQVSNDAWRKKRSKFKKNMSKFFPLEV